MVLYRVEVYDGEDLVRVRVLANQIAAKLYARKARSHGFVALLMVPRGEVVR